MYCAKCGAWVLQEEGRCRKCGEAVGAAVPPLTPGTVEASRFAAGIRRLGGSFVLFACLNIGLAVAGLISGLVGGRISGPLEPWPHPPLLAWTCAGYAAWTLLAVRTALAFAAGVALLRRFEGATTVATVAAIFGMTQFPIGLVFGAFVLARYSGRRVRKMYGALVLPEHATAARVR